MKGPPIVRLRRVFLDTSAYFALTDFQDTNHAKAKALAARFAQERWRLFTTNLILAETHALLLSRLGREIALKVLREIDRSATTIVRTTLADELKAREILEKYHDKDFSLCDAITFAVMERLGISSAFAFDQHFAQYGFTKLFAPQPGKDLQGRS